MEVSKLFLLAICISASCILVSVQARVHHHTKHRHHGHPSSQFSAVPSPPTSPSPSLSPSPSPSLSPPPITLPSPPSPPPITLPSPLLTPPPITLPSPSPAPSHSPPPITLPSPSPAPSHSPPPITLPSPSPSPSPSPPPITLPSPSPSPSPSPEPYPANVFDIRSFGAVGDGLTDETDAFKLAWETVCQFDSESPTLLIPEGHSFMIQSIMFNGPCKNYVVFQVNGTVMTPDGPDSWLQSNSKRQWLVFYRINGLSFQGGGVIDGKGMKWWDLPCKPHKGVNGTTLPGPCDSPVTLRFYMSSNLTVKGLKIQNSPQFNFRFDNCHGVHIDYLTIQAPRLSPNTDGIHIESTDHVGIYNSHISNGDDCVSIGSGCYNVDIKNLTCGPSHGISIGSLGNRNTRACVSNITVTDSFIKYSDNGVRIKTWQGGSGSVTGVTFNNIHMDTVRNPIIIDQFYCQAKDCANQTSAVYVSDISYTNIKGTYDVRSPPMHFGCSDSVPCTNLTLSDVELFPAQGDMLAEPFCWNAYGASEALTIPPVFCLMEGVPRSILENDIDRC